MRLARQLLIVVATSLVMFGPLFLTAVSSSGITLPIWSTGESAKYLTGGITDSKLLEKLTAKDILEGNLQKAINDEVENNVPLKLHALLGNAFLQRSIIASANAPFSYPCYPTYYSSTKLYSPPYNALAEMPQQKTRDFDVAYERFASKLSALANDYPETRFLIFICESTKVSPANPAHSLTSKPLVIGDVATLMQKATSRCKNVSIFYNEHHSAVDFYEDYCASDHHWNIRGAIRAYNIIAKALQWDSFPSDETFDVDGSLYNGYTSRGGLCLLNEKPFDTTHSFSNVSIQDGDELISGDEHRLYYRRTPYEQSWSFYDAYYSNIKHLEGPGSQTAIVIGDSFADALKRPLAMNLAKLDASREIHSDAKKNSGRLRDRLDEEKPDIVFFIAQATAYSRFFENNPNFFE